MNYLQPHRSECTALPKGWVREEYPRASGGISSRKSDIYYVSPAGKRVRSKPELLKVLGSDRYDLTAFDYQSGKINPHLLRNSYTAGNANKTANTSCGKSLNGRGNSNTSGVEKGGNYDYSRSMRSDASLVPPIRQTASIFKQPVTVHKFAPKPSSEDVKLAASTTAAQTSNKKSSTLDKPRQIFWEKRLSGLRPSYTDEEDVYEPFTLPSHFKPIGPGVHSDVLLASISTSIHLGSGSGTIRGQNTSKMNLDDKDVSAFINPDQPLISATSVTQEDIELQEAKVTATRAQLAKALEALSG